MSKYLERARIAFGLDPLDPELPLDTGNAGRWAALKAWEARHPTPAARSGSRYIYGGSYTKASGGPVQLATKSYGAPPLAVFSQTVTNYALFNALVDIDSTGRELLAGGSRVVSIKAAGTDRLAGDLADLETVDGRRYRVARDVLRRN